MYNGIGLPTPRGSGTSGYVQRNLATLRKFRDTVDYKTDDDGKQLDKQLLQKTNKELLAHEERRGIEVKCLEMETLMEEQGYVKFL